MAVGYPRMGNEPCLHPLLAVLEEAKLVVCFWLQPGDRSCARHIIAFTLELLGNLPRHIRPRVVRAESGFCAAPRLALLESQRLHYVVVARLLKPLQRLCRKETIWQPREVPGTEVTEVWHEEIGWERPRRLILIRHCVAEKKRPGGKKLLEVAGYTFQALSDQSARERAADHRVRAITMGTPAAKASSSNLDMDFALEALLEKVLRQRSGDEPGGGGLQFVRALPAPPRLDGAGHGGHLGLPKGRIISRTRGRTTIRLAVPAEQRGWW